MRPRLTAADIARLNATGVGSATADALVQYIERRVEPGNFLRAVLANNLNYAFAWADDVNVQAIGPLIRWIYNYAPGNCWGSKEAVEDWLGGKA